MNIKFQLKLFNFAELSNHVLIMCVYGVGIDYWLWINSSFFLIIPLSFLININIIFDLII